MTPEHAFLHAIKEEPDDDALRLILADWLEDNDQPERAEFVRLQVRRIRLPRGATHHTEMKRRELELLWTHSREWLGPLAVHPAVSCWDFSRGLLWLSVDASQRGKGALLADCADGTASLAWVDSLKVMNLDLTAALVESPVLPFLNALELSSHSSAKEVIGLVLAARWGKLTSLTLANNNLGNTGASALAGAARLGSLTRLDLTANRIGPEGTAALAESAHLAQLTWLNLGHNRIGAGGAVALAGSPYLANLTFLDLWCNNIDKEAAAVLRQRFGERVCL